MGTLIGGTACYPLWDESKIENTFDVIVKVLGNNARLGGGSTGSVLHSCVDELGPDKSLVSEPDSELELKGHEMALRMEGLRVKEMGLKV